MRVTEHVPGFVEGVEPRTAEVSSMDELLAVRWIDRWKTITGDAGLPFHRFSVDKRMPDSRCLMAEYNNGLRWWVIAYLPPELPEWVTLPTWEAKR